MLSVQRSLNILLNLSAAFGLFIPDYLKHPPLLASMTPLS